MSTGLRLCPHPNLGIFGHRKRASFRGVVARGERESSCQTTKSPAAPIFLYRSQYRASRHSCLPKVLSVRYRRGPYEAPDVRNPALSCGSAGVPAISAAQPATVPAEESTIPAEESTIPAEESTIPPAPNDTTTVEIRNNAFNPAQLNVAPGTTVTFVNNDTEPHTATADNGAFDTGVLQPGYSMDVFLDGSGTVPYHCELHPEMKGSIIVGEASGAEGTTTENPTDPAPTSSDDPRQTVSATQNMPGSDSTQSSEEAA